MRVKKVINGVFTFAVIFLATGCFLGPGEDERGTPGTVFYTETDYQTGGFGWIDSDGEELVSGAVPVYSDAVVRNYDGYVYILERMGADNIIKFDPDAEEGEDILYQEHLGDNWNPQDIEFVNATKAYIANMNEPKITVFNPSEGTVRKQIDISEYTVNPDANGSPYASALALGDNRCYVLLQRRDGFTPAEPSLILSINTEDDAIEENENITCTFKTGMI